MQDFRSQALRMARGRIKVAQNDSCGWTRPLAKTLVHRTKRPTHRIASALPLLLALLASPVATTPSAALPPETTPTSFSTLAHLETSETLISKCCPLGSNLALNPKTGLFICAPASEETERGSAENATTVAPTAGDERDSVRVVDLLRRGFPEWLYPKMAVVDSVGEEQEAQEFLKANPDMLVRLDRHPQCADSQIVSASRDPFRLRANGSLELRLGAWGGAGVASLLPDDFCADGVRGSKSGRLHATLLACPCRRVPCVRKCCSDKKLLHLSISRGVNVGCQSLPTIPAEGGVPSKPWRPVFHNEDLEPLENVETPTHHLVQNSLPHLTCPHGHAPVLLHDGYSSNDAPGGNASANRLWVMRNGSAFVQGFQDVKWLHGALWCSDASVPSEGEDNEALAHAHNVFFCAPTVRFANPDAAPTSATVAYASLFLVGALFLLLTLAVYVVLPELRAPPHSKALCCHCAALLISSMTLAVGKLSPYLPEGWCIPLALIIQFFILASFFWLNVMCIDISMTFSGFRGLLGSLMDTSRKKFLYYSLYAWGSPLIITSVTAILQEASDVNRLPKGILAPGIGRKTCWFDGMAATWAFLYGPMLALLVVNAALFGFTAIQLARAHRDGAELNRGDSVRHDRSSRLSTEKRKMILYAKLFLLMGVTWLMEVVSWAALPQAGDADDASAAWYVTDAVNMLRGVFIFVIFCCKRTVVRLLRKRLDAWGLRCACLRPLVHVERSATNRSGLSTRTSSMLPLGSLPTVLEGKEVAGSKGEAPGAAVEAPGAEAGVTGRETGSRKGALPSITV